MCMICKYFNGDMCFGVLVGFENDMIKNLIFYGLEICSYVMF